MQLAGRLLLGSELCAARTVSPAATLGAVTMFASPAPATPCSSRITSLAMRCCALVRRSPSLTRPPPRCAAQPPVAGSHALPAASVRLSPPASFLLRPQPAPRQLNEISVVLLKRFREGFLKLTMQAPQHLLFCRIFAWKRILLVEPGKPL